MSNIKINDVYQRIQYSAALSQTVFTVPYPFFQNNYIFVWVNGVELTEGGGAGQYTVAGAGSPSGGTVTLITPSVNGDIVTIEGKMPIDRTSIYSATISNLTGSDLNGDFNREVVMMKQIETVQDLLQLQYAPWSEVSQDVDVTTDRYIPILPPLYGWRKNAAGTAIEAISIPDGGFAPATATYLLQTPNADLPNSQAMSLLATGFVVNTTTTGVQLTRELEGTTDQIDIADPDGLAANPVMSLAANLILPGTEGMGLIRGTTAQRPGAPGANTFFRFNTTDEYLEYWDGSAWIQLVEDAGVLTITGTTNEIDVDSTDPQNPVLSLSATLDLPGTFTIQSSTVVDGIINDDTMATAAADNLATALSIKNYVDGLDGGNVKSVTGTANEIDVDNTDPQNPILALSSTLDVPGTFTIQASTSVDGIINDDTMASAAADNLATALSIKNYVDGLIGTAVLSVTGTANEVDVDNTDPQNPILSLSSILVAPGTIAVGNLFFDTNTISSTDTDGDLILTPDGAGNLVLDGLNWPQTDGTAGYILSTNGAGQLSWIPDSAGNPGGSDGQMQYNDGGVFNGDTGFSTDGAGALTAVSLAFSPSTGGIVGTTTNDNAGAGFVGEIISSQVLSTSPVALSNGTAANVTSISLTAGDWDVWGNGAMLGASNISSGLCWTSLTSATLPNTALVSSFSDSAGGHSAFRAATPYQRVSLSSTTTIYLSVQAGFGSGSVGASGGIFARRVR